MKRFYLLMLLLVSTGFIFLSGCEKKSRFQKLVWSDEFNEPGLPDTSKWCYNVGRGCPQNCGWGNNELQYYTEKRRENARVENGRLVIEARKETFEDAAYTSARLVTKNKADWKYGRVEARAKLPAGIGTWPAIWMLGANIDEAGWPGCGEIDIMEHKGSRLNRIYGTLHFPGYSGDNGVGGTIITPNAATEFHIYSIEWDETAIKFFVDGFNYFTFKNHTSVPYHQNFYIILNLAMGGNFGGAVDPLFKRAAMEIDYIRVYQ